MMYPMLYVVNDVLTAPAAVPIARASIYLVLILDRGKKTSCRWWSMLHVQLLQNEQCFVCQ